MFDIALSPDAALKSGLDVGAIAAAIPASYTVKGMFCGRFVGMLGKDFERLQPELDAPPRGGRYVAFKDYPQSDYTRIVGAAAAKEFPHIPLSEAVRRLARDDLATFASSVFGKVLLTLIGDARTSLLRAPEAYRRMAPGPQIHSEDLDPRTVRLTFDGHRTIAEYTLGQLEGIVLSFGRQPSVTVHKLAQARLAFDVTHGG